MSKLPLSRFKVIDLTRARSGPTAVRQLADWGADVLKVEAPGDDATEVGARHNFDFQNLHRNKRSLTLDLKQPDGVAILKRLAERADVLVENYRPDVKHRLGIDYERMRAINPRLVYASISGFGQDGPYRERPGLDQIAQGMGGLMSITGLPGQGPVRAGIAVADVTAGVFCAMGVLIALLEREESGEGQWVQSSLLGAQIALLDFQAARWLVEGEVAGQAGNDHPTVSPMGMFPTRDGFINIAPFGEPMWRRLCAILDIADAAQDGRFKDLRSRLANRNKLNRMIGDATRRQSSEYWIEQLNAESIPCGPIYTMDQVFADSQIRHLEIAQAVQHPQLGTLRLVGQPVEMSRSRSVLETAAPARGEHTADILREIGMSPDEIDGMKAIGAI
jgi:formyl-CoA transferase